MQFLLYFLFSFITLNFLLSTSAQAQCPVCIITVGGGMIIAKKLGIDDLLVSIWISALNTAIAFWLAPKIKNRLLNNPLVLSVLLYLSTLAYFQFTNQLGAVRNQFFGVDKIIFGQTLGLLVMILGNLLYLYSKKQNHDRALFLYSKVVFPVTAVILVTLFFKFTFGL